MLCLVMKLTVSPLSYLCYILFVFIFVNFKYYKCLAIFLSYLIKLQLLIKVKRNVSNVDDNVVLLGLLLEKSV